MNLPGLRIKSHWFKPGTQRTPEQQASAMAFIVWRTAHQMLKRMRGAAFHIDAGAPYFVFMREVLVFLIAVVDRIAHARMDGATRQAFTVALVRHVASTLADNEAELMGPRSDGAAHGDTFIDLVNELSAHYAEFGADPHADASALGFAPDFNFVRYLGSRLEPTLPPEDRRWVLDQVMASEAPAAVQVVQDAMRNLLSTESRPRRRATLSGD
ncbi:MAG: hypothetical protein KIT60_24185 [Burkholderiaceae bacterium]|nr:hypothetical protein [Burkholderiaceae bacterium]